MAINNAGYALVGLQEATTVEQVRRIMDTNFIGCVRVNRAVLPFMRKQRSGLLLHVSSGAGRLVVPGFGFYCASKFAMEAMAEAYHYELAGQGIESAVSWSRARIRRRCLATWSPRQIMHARKLMGRRRKYPTR